MSFPLFPGATSFSSRISPALHPNISCRPIQEGTALILCLLSQRCGHHWHGIPGPRHSAVKQFKSSWLCAKRTGCSAQYWQPCLGWQCRDPIWVNSRPKTATPAFLPSTLSGCVLCGCSRCGSSLGGNSVLSTAGEGSVSIKPSWWVCSASACLPGDLGCAAWVPFSCWAPLLWCMLSGWSVGLDGFLSRK